MTDRDTIPPDVAHALVAYRDADRVARRALAERRSAARRGDVAAVGELDAATPPSSNDALRALQDAVRTW